MIESSSTVVSARTGRPDDLARYLNLKLAAMGFSTGPGALDPYFIELATPLLRNYRHKDLLLGQVLCPADERIQSFLDRELGPVCAEGVPRLPSGTLTLDRAGLARLLSLPAAGDTFESPYVRSYRVRQGVLHNPIHDRRTTKGIFHIVEGELPVPAGKTVAPKIAFARILEVALNPPAEILDLPYTVGQTNPARRFVSLLLRPLVCPATGTDPAKTMEIRFFAPGSLVSNLDFVEGIFGNGGDPYLPDNDAALDPMHWTGHTGCVILAPHLVGMTKRAFGLPRWDDASEAVRRSGMCWKDEQEPYNEGHPFKITCRGLDGVIVTILADNYFGYCKKEVKTQISYAANLFGCAEEEHAGGALAFASYILGQEFHAGRTVRMASPAFDEAMVLLGDGVEPREEGYAVDRRYPNVFYVPGDAEFAVRDACVRWKQGNEARTLTLRAGCEYVLPNGYRVRLEKQVEGSRWRLIGVRPDSTMCHKPCTVSGGGKSEISKAISNAILKGPIVVKEYRRDSDYVDAILRTDFTTIYRDPPGELARRPLLSPERSLGSVIKLLTPSPDYTDEYNRWLRDLPQTLRQYVCLIKQHYRPEWGGRWRDHFTVDLINGFPGHELKLDDEKLVGSYLRVGFDDDGSWRIFKLRPDFNPAVKVQMEDDITASVVVPRGTLNGLDPHYEQPSVKLVSNCEALLFQRPDEAIHRGFDKQAEADIAGPDVFLSNFEPLSRRQAQELIDHVVEFDRFSEPMKRVLTDAVEQPGPEWVASSAHARLVDGKPSKNPRYLQVRPDLSAPRETYLAEVATRLHRRVPASEPLYYPVNAILAGRRGNPPEPNVPPLAVYNPIHYQEVPELFMDFICSLTGKSPSTTGFGSEGALTKRPFNALPPVIDLNNALVSSILTGSAGFTTAAGHVGPRKRVDHDFSMLVPELWCRMTVGERDPEFLIANGYLEKLNDFDFQGKLVRASRLGYRITLLFVDHFFGRIFETPDAVLPEDFLQPEKQAPAVFAAGVNAIVDSQRLVAMEYFDDGTIDAACPPLKALLHIMAHGEYEGMTLEDPALRAMFKREAMIASDWYRERLRVQQQRDVALWTRHAAALRAAVERNGDPEGALGLPARLAHAEQQLQDVASPRHLEELAGTIGADVRLGRPA